MTEFSDITVVDETETCPYLSDQTARMPLRMPLAQITPPQADQRLAAGHRRTGEFVYQTQCPTCEACEPIRVIVPEYKFSRNERRVLKRGDRQLDQQIGSLKSDRQRVDLFNKHRLQRGLSKAEGEIDLEEYIWGFVRSCFESFEMSYWIEDRLVALAVCDIGQQSLSAVYTFYDPEIKAVGLGTYSILKQIQFCQLRNLRYLYLGFYIEKSPHMVYKSRFRPHERRVSGKWERFGKLE